MLKSIQIKIVMIFTILGIIVIVALGLFSLYKLDCVSSYLNADIGAKEYVYTQAEQL